MVSNTDTTRSNKTEATNSAVVGKKKWMWKQVDNVNLRWKQQHDTRNELKRYFEMFNFDFNMLNMSTMTRNVLKKKKLKDDDAGR